MGRDTEEATCHPCKVQKKTAGPASGVKTQVCSDHLVKIVPGTLGELGSAHLSSKLRVGLMLQWVLQDTNYFGFQIEACFGGSSPLFALWM